MGLAATPASAAEAARVRVLHASPDAPSVDVHLDGAKVDALVNVPFASNYSDYLIIPPVIDGSRSIRPGHRTRR